MAKIVLFGGSGFIGTHLQKELGGNEIKIIHSSEVYNDTREKLAHKLDDQDTVINLAGESIFSLWTESKKKKIYDSRIRFTEKITEALRLCTKPPAHFVNASAIGIYKSETPVDESSSTYADNFLAETVKDWEKTAKKAEEVIKNVSIMRFGIVLGKGGGAYKVLRALTKYNLGGYFGDGDQSLSFIYIRDLVRAIRFITEKKINGVINITAPDTTNYKEFVKTLKNTLNSGIVWPVPSFIPKILAGESSILFLEGQIVQPEVLIKNNFIFEAPDIKKCIELIEEH